MSALTSMMRMVIVSLMASWTVWVAQAEKIEIKYLYPKDDPQSVASLKASLGLKDEGAARMQVYFFEIENLGLLKKGLALRLRKKGGDWEVTVKERPASAEVIAKGVGIEQDKTVLKDAKQSYSLETTVKEEVARKAIAGTDIAGLFSEEQQSFLGSRVDWKEVRCFPVIEALRWTLPETPGLKKLEAEEWNYAGTKVLELSLKAKVEEAKGKEEEFVKFLKGHQLDATDSGALKTEKALNALKGQVH